jgi:N6-adenosine-specific RNA methylase IME4
MQYKFHEIANIVPLPTPEEKQTLKESLQKNGFNPVFPIWLYENKILDGRNRYELSIELGIDPVFCEYTGTTPRAFVILANIARRHLTKDQLAIMALELVPEEEDEAKKRMESGANQYSSPGPNAAHPETGRATEKAAKKVGVGKTKVKELKKIQEEYPVLYKQIKEQKITQAQAWRKIKEMKREAKRQANREAIAQTQSPEEAIEKGKFSTIVLDPPWDWGDEGDVDQLGRAKPTYDTMSLERLLELPVGQFADTDCHIYLWITNRSLPKGFQLLEKWGFRYITAITWAKPNFGMGNYFRGQTEHILFGVKGSQPLKRKNASTLFTAPRGPKGHSSKPMEFYDFVESCSPGPYLEMFARGERKDWTSWGAEA